MMSVLPDSDADTLQGLVAPHHTTRHSTWYLQQRLSLQSSCQSLCFLLPTGPQFFSERLANLFDSEGWTKTSGSATGGARKFVQAPGRQLPMLFHNKSATCRSEPTEAPTVDIPEGLRD